MQTAIEAVADSLFEKRELLKSMKSEREELINKLSDKQNSIKNIEGLVFRLEHDLSKMHEGQKKEYYEGLKSADAGLRDGCNLSADSKQLNVSEAPNLPYGNSEFIRSMKKG